MDSSNYKEIQLSSELVFKRQEQKKTINRNIFKDKYF